jgi:pimeloyl-ACP methyl ester carboxylesterase
MNKLAPVVLMHGMWSTPDTLKDLTSCIESQGYEVFTPRLPFHYPLPQMNSEARKGLKNSGINDYLESLSSFINTLDEKPILVGHSLGGLLAQLLAARHECEKLVLISSAAPAHVYSWSWSVMRTFGHNLFKFPLWNSLLDLNIENVQYGIANSQSPELQQALNAETTLESGRIAWQVAMWFLYSKPVTQVEFSKINCPILVLGGSQDKITPIKMQRKIADKYGTQATLVEVKNACHWTVGGSFLPEISQIIFSWLNSHNTVDKGERHNFKLEK